MKKKKGIINIPEGKVLLVEVEWEDACGLGGWRSQLEIEFLTNNPVIVFSMGYLVSADDSSVIIAQSYGPAESGAPMKIPTGMVRQIRILDTVPKDELSS